MPEKYPKMDFRLSAEEKARLLALAEAKGVTASSLLRALVQQELAKEAQAEVA